MIIVSAFYYEKTRKGEFTWSWYALLLVIGWAGYIFILPLIAILVLYKDARFIKVMMWATIFVIFSSNIYKVIAKNLISADFAQEMIFGFCMIVCCYSCTLMSIKHLHESDGALTDSITSNLERVIRTVEQVKVASNSIVDGVTVVRELADENRVGAENVVNDMQELSNDNNVLNDKTMSSMEMTTVIDTQVKNVADLMEQVVELIGASVQHANTSPMNWKKWWIPRTKWQLFQRRLRRFLRNLKKSLKMLRRKQVLLRVLHPRPIFLL